MGKKRTIRRLLEQMQRDPWLGQHNRQASLKRWNLERLHQHPWPCQLH